MQAQLVVGCVRHLRTCPLRVEAATELRPRGHHRRRLAPAHAARPAGWRAARPRAAATALQDERDTEEDLGAEAASTHLAELRVKDFALIAEQRVVFQPGLNVITGESGSGKSVLMEAVGQVLGGPAPQGAIRPPADRAVVEARLRVAPVDAAALAAALRALGLPPRAAGTAPRSIRLRRELARGPDGSLRSRCYLNGTPTSVRVLRALGALLVDVNGQGAAAALRGGAAQLALVDRVAGTAGALRALGATLGALHEARAALRALDELADEGTRGAMQELVEQVAEAAAEPGEEAALRQELRALDARRAAAQRCALVAVGIGGGGGGDGGGALAALRDLDAHLRLMLAEEDRLAAAARSAAEGGSSDEAEGSRASCPSEDDSDVDDASAASEEEEGGSSASALLRRAQAALARAAGALHDAERCVEQYGRAYRFSAPRYEEASARLQTLERLARRHGARSVDELREEADRQSAALDQYFQMEGRRGELEARESDLAAEAVVLALRISAARRHAAGALCEAVQALLGELAMGGSVLSARLTWAPADGRAAEASSLALRVPEGLAGPGGEPGGAAYRLTPSGLDSVELLLAAGPGEPPKPLSAVASGGEASRILLALKAAPALLGARGGAADEGAASAGAAQAPGAAGRGSESEGGLSQGLAPIVVLDEIDSGVGGRLGQQVGSILRRLASPRTEGAAGAGAQVLCVSHLPQVAAHAHHHLCVRKQPEPDGRVTTRFEALAREEDRVAEVAAMLGLSRDAAAEVLRAAQGGAS